MTRTRRLAQALALIPVIAVPAAAAAGDDPAARYTACMERVERDPRAAFDAAVTWEELGGGPPARHCQAKALLAMDAPAEAAHRLQTLADSLAGRTAMRADLLIQAGRAWLRADMLGQADRTLATARELAPDNATAATAHATVLLAAGKDWEAVDALNAALEAEPKDIGALVLRATAYRYLDSPDLAAADIERALTRDPDHPDALLERGILHRLAGREQKARDTWMTLIETHPDTPAAQAARDQIAAMDGD